MAKRKIPYAKVTDGLEHCFGAFGRNCDDCPYDDYNDKDDMFGDAPAWCHDKLVKDIRRWSQELAGFTHCEDCCCYHPDLDENENYRYVKDPKDGFCSVWRVMMFGSEFCSRGARND